MIQFFVAGNPAPQPRVKATEVKGLGIRMYTPAKADEWKRACYISAMCAMKAAEIQTPITIPVSLYLTFMFARPQYMTVKKFGAKEFPMAIQGRNDCDNLAKAVMDAFAGMKLRKSSTVKGPPIWSDDGLVWDLHVKKLYVGEGQTPGCFITIEI